jgi:hypothetical protein
MVAAAAPCITSTLSTLDRSISDKREDWLVETCEATPRPWLSSDVNVPFRLLVVLICIPSTNIIGWVELSVLIPLNNIIACCPGCPEIELICAPAIFPTSA